MVKWLSQSFFLINMFKTIEQLIEQITKSFKNVKILKKQKQEVINDAKDLKTSLPFEIEKNQSLEKELVSYKQKWLSFNIGTIGKYLSNIFEKSNFDFSLSKNSLIAYFVSSFSSKDDSSEIRVLKLELKTQRKRLKTSM